MYFYFFSSSLPVFIFLRQGTKSNRSRTHVYLPLDTPISYNVPSWQAHFDDGRWSSWQGKWHIGANSCQKHRLVTRCLSLSPHFSTRTAGSKKDKHLINVFLLTWIKTAINFSFQTRESVLRVWVTFQSLCGVLGYGVSHYVRALIGSIWETLRKPLTHLVKISRNLQRA